MTNLTGDGGSVAGAVLPELFARLERERWTGALVVEQGEKLSRAYFRGGNLVGAMVYGRFKPLGITFLESGTIDIEALNASLAIIASAKVPQGQVLVEMGAISEDQLNDGLRTQLMSCAGAFLLLTDGEWRLEDQTEFPVWTEGLELNPGKVVLEAFRRPEAEPLLHDILDEVGSTRIMLRVDPPQVIEDLALEPEEARALAHLDGEMEIREVARVSGLDLHHALALAGTLSIFHLVAGTGSDHEIAELVPHLETDTEARSVPVVPEPVSLPTPNAAATGSVKKVRVAAATPAPAVTVAESSPEAKAPEKPRAPRKKRPAAKAAAPQKKAAPPVEPPVSAETDHERAEKLFRQGMEFFERENYEGALPFLRDAVHLDPTQGLWTAYFAWTLYSVGPPEVVVPQVKQMLELAAESEEGGERARYFLGMISESEADDGLDAWL